LKRAIFPFFVISGDLLLAGPIVCLASKESFSKMAASAGQGGLIPWQLNFPFFEYRPFRSFSLNQSTSLADQFNFGVDIPGKVTMLEPANAPAVPLKTIWFLGVRVYFDWRYYFANK